MKLEETFEFDQGAYAATIAQADTQHLRQQEIVKTRQIIKSKAGVYAGTAHAIVSGGLTAIHPIYASRAGEVAKSKLQIIQAELLRRGVPLHQEDEEDANAATAGFLVGEAAGDLGGDVFGDAFGSGISETSLGPVAADLVAGEIGEGAMAEETDGVGKAAKAVTTGTIQCSRSRLGKHHRLQCSHCRYFFDASYTEYLRELPIPPSS